MHDRHASAQENNSLSEKCAPVFIIYFQNISRTGNYKKATQQNDTSCSALATCFTEKFHLICFTSRAANFHKNNMQLSARLVPCFHVFNMR